VVDWLSPRTSNQFAARKPLPLPLPSCICTLDSDGRLHGTGCYLPSQSGIRRGEGNLATILGARREALIFRGVCATPPFIFHPSFFFPLPPAAEHCPPPKSKNEFRIFGSTYQVYQPQCHLRRARRVRTPHPRRGPPLRRAAPMMLRLSPMRTRRREMATPPMG
jgi:hypothetical protein